MAENQASQGTTGPAGDEATAAGSGSVGRLLTDDALYTRLVGIAGEVEGTIKNLRDTTDAAEGSPRGDDRWSGVALALFVRNDALSRTPGEQP